MTSHKIEKLTQLKNGLIAEDPRLGRVPEFDERSRAYSVGELIDDNKALRGHSWVLGFWLNQGQTSACTGNARTYDLGAYPRPLKKPDGSVFDEPYAQALYHLAQRNDEWAGENYEGSSVLGALKAAVLLGFVGEYRWAFDFDDWLWSIGNIGGSVVGTTWLNSMFDPRPSGLLEVDASSGEAGGHSYYVRGIAILRDTIRRWLGGSNYNEPIRAGIPLLRIRNSWWTPSDPYNSEWGHKGEAFMWADDYERHLWDGGEQSVVTSPFTR
jgi:hypothetical protein